MGNFGVELHRVVAAGFVSDASDGAARGGRHELEPWGNGRDLVAMAHPDLEHAVAFRGFEIFNAIKQARVTMNADFSVAELAMGAGLDLAALLYGHGEHAVANTQHGHLQIPHRLRGAQILGFVGGGVTAGQDDALRRKLAHELVAHIGRVNFAVNMGLTDATRDELGDLGSEVEDQNFVVHVRLDENERGKEFGIRKRPGWPAQLRRWVGRRAKEPPPAQALARAHRGRMAHPDANRARAGEKRQ